MNKLFNVGDTIYGFCNGYFGRDDYYTKICVMVTEKYAIFQYTEGFFSQGYATVLNYREGLNLDTVNTWKVNPYE